MGRSVNPCFPPSQITSLTDALYVLFICFFTPVSIFAFLSLGLFPIPLIFIRYGKQLRAGSRFAQEAQAVIMRMGDYNFDVRTIDSEQGTEASLTAARAVVDPEVEKASA